LAKVKQKERDLILLYNLSELLPKTLLKETIASHIHSHLLKEAVELQKYWTSFCHVYTLSSFCIVVQQWNKWTLLLYVALFCV